LDDTDAQASGVWPELEALAQPAKDRRRLPPEVRSRIILELCARSPLSVKELSVLLDRSEAYIGDAIRPLVTSGELTFLHPDQPRHPKQKYLTALRTKTAPTSPAVTPQAEKDTSGQHAPSGTQPFTRPAARPQPRPAPPAERAAREEVAVAAAARFPNQLTNVVAVLITGILLAKLNLKVWPLAAMAMGLALAVMHVFVESAQYRRFRELHANRGRRKIAFVMLKAGVALVEIAIVYFAASAFRGTP
jgi:hypothetical protein